MLAQVGCAHDRCRRRCTRRWKKPPLIKSAWLRWTLIVGVVVYLALVTQTTPVNWTRVWEGLPRGAAFVAHFSRRTSSAGGKRLSKALQRAFG